ncbi:MAG: gamma carbonic anhydrase family protein [Jatrophihabitans sp.]|nr:gamma carbonic anhydrase family protein [Jatrophihabitans sp.]
MASASDWLDWGTVNLFEYEGQRPTIAEDAWIAPTATIIGDVTIEAGASIWYGAVLRGDDGPIVIRERANVQDGTVIHTTPEVTTEIGRGATVAHQCMIHGAVLEEEALVGNGCVVLDGARIGARSMIAAMSLVQPGVQIPPGVLAAGVPAVVKKDIAGTPAEFWVKMNPVYYPELAKRHSVGIRRIENPGRGE